MNHLQSAPKQVRYMAHWHLMSFQIDAFIIPPCCLHEHSQFSSRREPDFVWIIPTVRHQGTAVTARQVMC